MFLCTVANQCTYVSIEDGVVRVYQSVCHVVLLFVHSCFKDVFIILGVFSLSLLFFIFINFDILCVMQLQHTHVCMQWHFALLLQTASKVGHVEFL